MSFAVIWIMMAKGSKAWYEVYERYIFEIEREETDGLKIPERYRLGALCRPWEMNSNLFSKKAGRYSPSRLNITIGTVLMTAWFVIFLLHYIASIVATSAERPTTASWRFSHSFRSLSSSSPSRRCTTSGDGAGR